MEQIEEATELLKKARRRLGQYQEPPVIRAGKHPLRVVYDSIDQAITILRKVLEPCKTCDGSGKDLERGSLEPCPDCKDNNVN